MFGAGPAWLMFIRLRIPSGHPRRHWRDWLSIAGRMPRSPRADRF